MAAQGIARGPFRVLAQTGQRIVPSLLTLILVTRCIMYRQRTRRGPAVDSVVFYGATGGSIRGEKWCSTGNVNWCASAFCSR